VFYYWQQKYYRELTKFYIPEQLFALNSIGTQLAEGGTKAI